MLTNLYSTHANRFKVSPLFFPKLHGTVRCAADCKSTAGMMPSFCSALETLQALIGTAMLCRMRIRPERFQMDLTTTGET